MRGIARETGFVLDMTEPLLSARRLRDLRSSELDGISPALLDSAARHLRAAAYVHLTAARRFEHRARILREDR